MVWVKVFVPASVSVMPGTIELPKVVVPPVMAPPNFNVLVELVALF